MKGRSAKVRQGSAETNWDMENKHGHKGGFAVDVRAKILSIAVAYSHRPANGRAGSWVAHANLKLTTPDLELGGCDGARRWAQEMSGWYKMG